LILGNPAARIISKSLDNFAVKQVASGAPRGCLFKNAAHAPSARSGGLYRAARQIAITGTAILAGNQSAALEITQCASGA
jgi:hypothetical protein